MAKNAKSTEVLDPKLTKRSLVEASVKMHLGVVQAELRYLQETGEVSGNVLDLLSHTMGMSLGPENGPNPLPLKIPKPTLEILHPPQTMVVKEEYLPRTCRGLVVNCGDEVAVFGWADHRSEAIAYNTRIRRAGRLPAEMLSTFDSKPFEGGNLCIAKEQRISKSIDGIGWSAGDYIMVWDRKEGKHCAAEGFGFNRATGSMQKLLLVESCGFFLCCVNTKLDSRHSVSQGLQEAPGHVKMRSMWYLVYNNRDSEQVKLVYANPLMPQKCIPNPNSVVGPQHLGLLYKAVERRADVWLGVTYAGHEGQHLIGLVQFKKIHSGGDRRDSYTLGVMFRFHFGTWPQSTVIGYGTRTNRLEPIQA
ncbi:hypothetical protein BU23DRAFT_575851 [Bimuria novae-zelandiae CBS 107.79]|uniref:Uncharacterized protein n=1 Tax=Bimuria novae-zelandiae CBS 107.79 TaxID=1447943 RepID=A0A6A5USZ6_9PLEO|nr:hypothetical protein BU23DRAFT_575851 [Bimuria novae-zelandiae CBS 107.79]